MKQSFKLFEFQGTPVYISIWFFLLFLIFSVPVTIGLFVSVLLHEMGHAWMANRKGYHVYSISVDMLSGAAAVDSNMHDRDAISITAAGPITTLLLCLLSYFGSLIIDSNFLDSLFTINAYLFVFNILPIYPMDGGQIVKSYANLSRNRYKARKIAASISLIFSLGLVVYGVWNLALILALFGGYFAYIALKDLGYIK